MTDKKVKLNLVGIDGNAFSIMGAFSNQARKEGWTKEEINEVFTEAKSGDYNHLLSTISDHCDNDDEMDEEDENDDYDDYDDELEDDYLYGDEEDEDDEDEEEDE